MAANIDPQLLAQILAAAGQRDYQTTDAGTYASQLGGNVGGYAMDPNGQFIYRSLEDPSGFGTAKWDTWDPSGQYLGAGSGDSDLRGIVKAIATAAAMYGGATAMAGGGGGAATGAGGGAGGAAAGGAGAGSITLPTVAEMGFTGATVTPELLATMPELTMAGGAAAGGAAGAAASGGGSGGAAAPAGSGTGGMWDAAKGMLGNNGMQTVGGLLGAVAGGLSARDQTQSTNRDPWGPAQPFLRGLLDQSQQLSQQYQKQPFSPTQKQAYSNQFGLLNAINQAAPGLLAGMQQNASGANAYDRTNPRKQLQGSNPQFQWTPGLLNPFGG